MGCGHSLQARAKKPQALLALDGNLVVQYTAVQLSFLAEGHERPLDDTAVDRQKADLQEHPLTLRVVGCPSVAAHQWHPDNSKGGRRTSPDGWNRGARDSPSPNFAAMGI